MGGPAHQPDRMVSTSSMRKLLSNTTGEYIPGISVGHAAISSQTTIHTDKNETGMIPLNTINLNQYSQINSLSRS